MSVSVWFTGAQGTGKSTQLNIFLEAHPNYNKVVYLRRSLLDAGAIKLNRDATILDEMFLAYDVGSSVINTTKPCISDRCWVDKCAYAQLLYYNDTILNALDVINRQIFAELQQYIMPPNKVIYFPPTIPLVADGVRDIDLEYQQNVDWWIQYYLSGFDIPYYMLESTSIGDRTMEIEQVVFGSL